MKACASVGQVEAKHAISVALVHRRFGRVGQAAHGIFGACHSHAVHQQVDFIALCRSVFVDALHLAIHLHAVESLLQVDLQLLLQRAVLTQANQCQHRISRSFGIREHAVYDVFRRVFLHLFSAHRTECFADACVQQAQILVYLGRCSYGRSRIPAVYLLLDGDGGRDSFNEVALGFAHPSEKLAGVTAQTLYVTALSFGV